MSKLLAVSWNSQVLRYVLAEPQKRGAVRVLNAGEKSCANAADINDSGTASPNVVSRLRELVSELNAGRLKLVLCVGRGSVDSLTFTVPPASETELPTLVQNMAQRQLSGPGGDTTIDFVSFPLFKDGSRQVSAMAMAPGQEKLIHRMVEASGSTDVIAVVATHPLRVFVPPQVEANGTASLVVSKGKESAHILVVQHQRPVISRTLRLATGATCESEARFITAEIQRTILTVGDKLERGVEITTAVLVGPSGDTDTLVSTLEGAIDAVIIQSSTDDLVNAGIGEAAEGGYAPLIAAVWEAAGGFTPVIDFLNPKRPPAPTHGRNRLITIAVGLLLLVGGSWYYVSSMFGEWDEKIGHLEFQLQTMQENVDKTASIRRQAAGLARWEQSRMNWLDEIRDITIRMPPRPELSVREFAATPAGSGFAVTFQGTSSSPEAHRAMELGIQDRYHTTRTPSFSESRNGKDVVWNFRTTLQIRQRSKENYTAHRKPETHREQIPVFPSTGSQATTTQATRKQTSGVRDKLYRTGVKSELEPPQS